MALTAQEIEALMPDCTELLSDEPEMESSLHYTQLLILVTCLEWLWRDREDFFIGANLSVYYSRQQLKNRDFRGPGETHLINKDYLISIMTQKFALTSTY